MSIHSGSRSKNSHYLRLRRKARIRKNLSGSAVRPRVSFFKSSKHIYVQVIDDVKGVTLTSISSFGKKASAKLSDKRANVEVCNALGKDLAQDCTNKRITKVVFDRGGYPYHGRVKSFAEGARSGGLEF